MKRITTAIPTLVALHDDVIVAYLDSETRIAKISFWMALPASVSSALFLCILMTALQSRRSTFSLLIVHAYKRVR